MAVAERSCRLGSLVGGGAKTRQTGFAMYFGGGGGRPTRNSRPLVPPIRAAGAQHGLVAMLTALGA